MSIDLLKQKISDRITISRQNVLTETIYNEIDRIINDEEEILNVSYMAELCCVLEYIAQQDEASLKILIDESKTNNYLDNYTCLTVKEACFEKGIDDYETKFKCWHEYLREFFAQFYTYYDIKVYPDYKYEYGFNFQPGFAASFDENGLIDAATSGNIFKKYLNIFYPDEEGGWEKSRIYMWDPFAKELRKAMDNYWEGNAILGSISRSKDQELYISNETIYYQKYVTENARTRKCNEKLYHYYVPLKDYPGLYYHYIMSEHSETKEKGNCQFCNLQDACMGTYDFYLGIRAITKEEYNELYRHYSELAHQEVNDDGKEAVNS